MVEFSVGVQTTKSEENYFYLKMNFLVIFAFLLLSSCSSQISDIRPFDFEDSDITRQAVLLGGTAMFNCSTKNPQTTPVVFKNGTATNILIVDATVIIPGQHLAVQKTVESQTITYSFQILNVTPDDAGTYVCELPRVGDTYKGVLLEVVVPDFIGSNKFMHKSLDKTVALGDNVILYCGSLFIRPESCTWLKTWPETTVLTNNDNVVTTDDRFSVQFETDTSYSCNLLIVAASREDNGTYTCMSTLYGNEKIYTPMSIFIDSTDIYGRAVYQYSDTAEAKREVELEAWLPEEDNYENKLF